MNNDLPKQVSIIGAGYVGMSLAALIAEFVDIKIWDTDKRKRELINSKKLTIEDKDSNSITENLKNWNITASENLNDALTGSDLVMICIPTDFNESLNAFDVSGMTNLIKDIGNVVPDVQIVIKSTLPIGYSHNIHKETGLNIIFSPEFLREGMALSDNQFPSRIIIGKTSEMHQSEPYLSVIKKISKKLPTILTMTATEAESVKLFSNTYLAMRIAFFNEIDSFALENSLSIQNIIRGISEDPRIGNLYNNPSFGFGGYCLPKDSKQALASIGDLPNKILESINASNKERKSYLIKYLVDLNKDSYGFYRINMKKNSDNFRESSSINLLEGLLDAGKKVLIYEPLLKHKNQYLKAKLIHNLDKFKQESDLIIANRISEEILDCGHKLFTRDFAFDIQI